MFLCVVKASVSNFPYSYAWPNQTIPPWRRWETNTELGNWSYMGSPVNRETVATRHSWGRMVGDWVTVSQIPETAMSKLISNLGYLSFLGPLLTTWLFIFREGIALTIYAIYSLNKVEYTEWNTIFCDLICKSSMRKHQTIFPRPRKIDLIFFLGVPDFPDFREIRKFLARLNYCLYLSVLSVLPILLIAAAISSFLPHEGLIVKFNLYP